MKELDQNISLDRGEIIDIKVAPHDSGKDI